MWHLTTVKGTTRVKYVHRISDKRWRKTYYHCNVLFQTCNNTDYSPIQQLRRIIFTAVKRSSSVIVRAWPHVLFERHKSFISICITLPLHSSITRSLLHFGLNSCVRQTLPTIQGGYKNNPWLLLIFSRYSKSPPLAAMQAVKRLVKFATAFVMCSCGNSSQMVCNIQLINRLGLRLEFTVLFQHDAPDMTV